MSVTIVKVKPEMVTEWEKSVLPDINAALKKGGYRGHYLWQTANYGDLYEYISAVPIDSFASLDGTPVFVRALGEEGSGNLMSRIHRSIADAHRYALIYEQRLSIEPKTEPKMAVVTTYRVAPGRSADFERFLEKEYVPALRKAEVDGYMVHRAVFGGSGDEYVNLLLIKNYAEIDKGPALYRAVGREAGQQMMTHLTGIVTSTERTLSKFRPDLSFQAPKEQ